MSERDTLLIAEFNARHSETAFAALVRQHVNLVFATAFRQVGDAGAAEEITQNVFVALAQAAGKLGAHPTIAGWLHRTTLNKSREWLRSELRRRKRERVVVNLELARAEGDSVWSPLVLLLDEALLALRETDRQAVILHFMEGQTFQEVGSALDIGEDAARKRVNRCLGELASFFRRRGFAVPALAAGAPLFALSSHAAPAGLAASAATAGLATVHSAASSSTLTLIKGALKIMAWTKAKTAIVAGAAVILAATSTTVIGIRVLRAHRAAAEPTTGLSPIAQTVTADIQPDGTILLQMTVEETNNTGLIIATDNINDVDASWLATDELGNALKITKRPRGGIFVALNRAVPPGGTISYTVEGKLVGFLRKNGAGECEVELPYGDIGNATEARVAYVWRLPLGVTLLQKDGGMAVATNQDGRIELTIDKMIPPNGKFPINFRYKLATAK